MFWCWWKAEPGDPETPTEQCAYAWHVEFNYSVFCMLAMSIQWFLIVDLAVFVTQLSAFMLVVRSVLPEIGRFMVALGFLLLTFGSAISVLEHDQEEFQTIAQSSVALYAITVKLYQDDYRGIDEPALVMAVFCYQTAVSILLLNLLIAQLQCSYEHVNEDATGYARLTRSIVIAETLTVTPPARWALFVDTLEFEKRLEFNEGDIGVNGGVQLLEPSRNHPIVLDTILRYGGSCSPEQPWPADAEEKTAENKFDKMERLLQRTIKKMVMADSGKGTGSHGTGSGTGTGTGSGSGSGQLKSGSSGGSSD